MERSLLYIFRGKEVTSRNQWPAELSFTGTRKLCTALLRWWTEDVCLKKIKPHFHSTLPAPFVYSSGIMYPHISYPPPTVLSVGPISMAPCSPFAYLSFKLPDASIVFIALSHHTTVPYLHYPIPTASLPYPYRIPTVPSVPVAASNRVVRRATVAGRADGQSAESAVGRRASRGYCNGG